MNQYGEHFMSPFILDYARARTHTHTNIQLNQKSPYQIRVMQKIILYWIFYYTYLFQHYNMNCLHIVFTFIANNT